MTVETWPAAGASEDPKPQWVGNMDDRYLFADPSSAYSLHTLIDPAIRQRWMEDAETKRDQRPRSWMVEYRRATAGETTCVYGNIGDDDLSPAEAWNAFHSAVKTLAEVGMPFAGDRMVLVAGSAGAR
jgi:hypothetical protein